MNLSDFLRKVDSCLDQMSASELKAFIHDEARRLSEAKRRVFLERLGGYLGEENIDRAASDKNAVHELQKQADQMCSTLQQIADGDRHLESEYNPEYDDWYASDEPEIIFSDPSGILNDIERACDLLLQCVDAELWKDAVNLIDALDAIAVPVSGDYVDSMGDTELTIEALNENNLIRKDWDHVVAEACYAVYRMSEIGQRPEKIYDVLKKSCVDRVMLEDIMQCGNEDLPEFAAFLPLWQEFLAQTVRDQQKEKSHFYWSPQPNAARLLEEAAAMSPDIEEKISAARKFGLQDPKLYLAAVEQLEEDNNLRKALDFAEEALQEIPAEVGPAGVIEKIAHKACELAEKTGKQKNLNDDLMRAFCIHPSPDNYLRLMFDSTEFEKMQRSKVKAIYEERLRRPGRQDSEMLTIALLDGEYAYVLGNGLNVKEPLGWSYTFMKQGIALFLLASYDGNYRQLPPALRRMFSYAGVPSFEDAYPRWIEKRLIPGDIREEAMKRIEDAMDERLKAIMGKHRDYYGECADFLAAIGEVRESNGEDGAKDRILNAYHAKYKRCSAFTPELKRYTSHLQ
ncbi:MAG: hypothetical protein ACI4EB_10205 [Bilifractor sp.]